jgi:hypothetical protein
MEEVKEYIFDRVTYLLIGINALVHYLGIENIKSTILWVLTITLLIVKIRSQYLKYKADKKDVELNLEIKKEELRLKRIESFNKERENFNKLWKNDHDSTSN